MFVRNRLALLLLLVPGTQACAYASTDGFVEDLDGSGDGLGPSGSGGQSSVGGPPSGGSTATDGTGPQGTGTGGGASSGGSSSNGSGTGGGDSDPTPGPGPGPFPFPGPGSGAGSGGASGSGGSAGNACTPVTCGGGTYPKPTGNVCFSFTTSQFGGWQASNTAGCTLIFDGTVTAAPGVNPTSAGAHELEFAGCTSPDIGWSCWN